MKLLLGLASTCLLTGGIALASPLTTLPGATFGGTGIPNTDVEVTTINNGGDTITLGLTATPRYPNQTIGSPLPNDGNGTFYATPGFGVTPGRATWNFDFYIGIANGDFANYTFKLFYGMNPASLASFDPVAVANADGSTPGHVAVTATTREDSENMVFFPPFDANANGQYFFELQAFSVNPAGAPVPLGKSDITVNVGTVPDTTSGALLLGLGLASLAIFGHRQNRLAMMK